MTSTTIDNDNNIQDPKTFAINDNSSQFVRFLPEKYIEPLVIIARIKGYDSIDNYILNLIKDRLEMFADTRDGLDDYFQEYMHDRMVGKDVPNKSAHKDKEESEEEEEKEDSRK